MSARAPDRNKAEVRAMQAEILKLIISQTVLSRTRDFFWNCREYGNSLWNVKLYYKRSAFEPVKRGRIRRGNCHLIEIVGPSERVGGVQPTAGQQAGAAL